MKALTVDEASPTRITVSPIEGKRFTICAPWRCICCGIGISFQQFCFSTSCGFCDTGACQPRNRAFRHTHDEPPWWVPEPNIDPIAGRKEWIERKRQIWENFAKESA